MKRSKLARFATQQPLKILIQLELLQRWTGISYSFIAVNAPNRKSKFGHKFEQIRVTDRTKEGAKVMPKSELSQVGEKVKINLADGDTLYHQVAT